jgi:hypothetical protein
LTSFPSINATCVAIASVVFNFPVFRYLLYFSGVVFYDTILGHAGEKVQVMFGADNARGGGRRTMHTVNFL